MLHHASTARKSPLAICSPRGGALLGVFSPILTDRDLAPHASTARKSRRVGINTCRTKRDGGDLRAVEAWRSSILIRRPAAE
jgi:hypothetical protein